MGWFRIKIRPADKLFSEYIRKRDRMLCQYNFRCYPGTVGNQTSHFQKRGKESVRFDVENGDWCCSKCHYFVENDKDGKKTLEQWKFNQLGKARYVALMIRANDDSKKHKDDKMNILILKELIKTL